jgi:hypothetical protein
MWKKVYLLVLLLSLLATASIASASRPKELNFDATLNGGQEVPPVSTSASAIADLRFNNATTLLYYKFRAVNLENVTAVHIHCAPARQNGPVGVTLAFVAAGITSSPDAGNACGWLTMQDVYEAILAGNAYVNIHTTAHPTGEIRGQIRWSARIAERGGRFRIAASFFQNDYLYESLAKNVRLGSLTSGHC